MGGCNCKHESRSHGVCVECDIPQLSRNNYFTGKLLVERDFTDEQRYLLGKLRRHNQRLHGWGSVCGLKVKQHPNPGCQDRFVVIEPGTAIDCCGREIYVSREEYFEFSEQFLAKWRQQHGPNAQPDPEERHRIQICISYRECGTEDIPALFDDCSCDATSCQPNRILDSYSFDVLLADNASPTGAGGAELEWSNTLHFADAVRVAGNSASKRLYILSSSTTGGTTTATVYQLDLADYNVMGAVDFAASNGLDVAVSPAGDFVYVAVQPTAAATPEVHVLDAAGLSSVAQFSVGSAAADPTFRLSVVPAPDGRLLVSGKTIGVVLVSGMNVSSPPPLQTPIAIANPVAAAVSPSSRYAYFADGSSKVSWSDLSASSPTSGTPQIDFGAGTAISSLALAETTKGDMLAALDTTSPALYFANIPPAGPPSASLVTQHASGFAFPPMQVVLSGTGQWAYVLEQETATGKAYVQAVNEHAVETAQPGALGVALPVGFVPVSEAIADDGGVLYVPFSGQPGTDTGGVAVVEILEDLCCDVFKHPIECPDCTDGNCIILATINGYRYGQAVVDADIDNVTDRRLLVSTEVLTRVVRCLCEQGAGGGAGPQGPPGDPGKDGEPGADGGQGPAGPGLEIGLVQIHALSWTHTGSLTLSSMIRLKSLPSLVIAFNGAIKTPSSADGQHIFQVQLDPQAATNQAHGYQNLCNVLGTVVPVDATVSGNLVTGATLSSGPTTKALAFIFPRTILQVLSEEHVEALDMWVRLRGDFLLDTGTPPRAVSAEFVRADFDTGERPPASGLCLEGGTFESWVQLNVHQG
jgi:hypothetical protein